ncbi:hypothetical protein HaLaN_17802 [Haematococcus lacustris]|uniref:Uncharacterized protein n=1 Tax=Haematococcus lacustris TaxID=44745 RepID=A0A699ZQI5_HAELA|nr:hypothetical protein HaLaN_17802 [Haematococcus lacustris]
MEVGDGRWHEKHAIIRKALAVYPVILLYASIGWVALISIHCFRHVASNSDTIAAIEPPC